MAEAGRVFAEQRAVYGAAGASRLIVLNSDIYSFSFCLDPDFNITNGVKWSRN